MTIPHQRLSEGAPNWLRSLKAEFRQNVSGLGIQVTVLLSFVLGIAGAWFGVAFNRRLPPGSLEASAIGEIVAAVSCILIATAPTYNQTWPLILVRTPKRRQVYTIKCLFAAISSAAIGLICLAGSVVGSFVNGSGHQSASFLSVVRQTAGMAPTVVFVTVAVSIPWFVVGMLLRDRMWCVAIYAVYEFAFIVLAAFEFVGIARWLPEGATQSLLLGFIMPVLGHQTDIKLGTALPVAEAIIYMAFLCVALAFLGAWRFEYFELS